MSTLGVGDERNVGRKVHTAEVAVLVASHWKFCHEAC